MFPDLGSKQYEFINRIGGGGFGVVNLAIDLHTGKPVAIKSIHKNYNKRKDLIENFKREANIYLDLSHPNIVKLNAFIINDGVHLVMEYVEGRTLEDFINKETGPIPTRLCLDLLTDIISAIDYAHNKNIPIDGYEHGALHLDLKPSNVLITKSNKAMVIDYGISKGLTEKRKVREHTKMYCAPEQLDAEKDLDKRTDIYSLGLLMHQMLCGSSPYTANSNEELEDKVKYRKTKRMIDIYPAISEEFQQIVDKATEKNPNSRYQSCSEFLADLEILTNNPENII